MNCFARRYHLRSKTKVVTTKIAQPELIDSGNTLKTNNSHVLAVSPPNEVKPPKTHKAWFTWLKTTRNPKYLDGIHPLKPIEPRSSGLSSFESCLLNDKSDKIDRFERAKRLEFDQKNAINTKTDRRKTGKKGLSERSLAIVKEPKHIVTLQYIEIDAETGECLGLNTLETDSFKSSNASKIRAMDLFSDVYNDLYYRRRVTLLFHTFTRANACNKTWSGFMDLLLKRYKRLGIPVLGYVWVLEVGEKDGMIHYHLVTAINRTRFKTLPRQLKFEDAWRSRTKFEFVQKNVRRYMAKYFAKNRHRVLDLETNRTLRSLGKSKTFKVPHLYSEN